MDVRSFLVGAICGVVIYGAATWMLEESPQDTAAVPESNAPNIDPNALPERGGDEPSAPGRSPPTSDIDDRTLATPASEGRFVPSTAVTAPTDPGAVPAAPETIERTETSDPTSRWLAGAYEGFASEPKDDSWAYYMEQALLQFLTDHPSMPEFEISYVECRTTRCQMQVAGYDESTAATWHRIMYDLTQQPWNEFGQSGNSSSTVDGRLVIIQDLHRRQSGN